MQARCQYLLIITLVYGTKLHFAFQFYGIDRWKTSRAEGSGITADSVWYRKYQC